MMFSPDELNKKQVWILGTKLKTETNFFLQIVDNYTRYSSLFTKLNNNKDVDFYFMEIDLPNELKPETAPF